MPDPINYEAVLADLLVRRAALDAAIAAIEPLAGVSASPGALQGIRNGNGGNDEIRPDTFFGLSVPQATKKYLGMTGREPKSPAEIAEALKSGGQGQASYTNVYTALKRLRIGGEVHKLPNGDWGLAEWYPGARVPSRRSRPSGDVEAVEGEPDAPDGDDDDPNGRP